MTTAPIGTSREPRYSNPVDAFARLRLGHGQWWHASDRASANPHPWPVGHTPADAPVFAHNEAFIAKPPGEVFAALTQATQWSNYYPNADHVKLPAGKTRLEPGLSFSWSTFGTPQRSQVQEFVPGKVLAWSAESLGTHAYHRWILEPAPGGTRVITEETQTGPTAMLDQALMNPGLHAAHQLWLTNLANTLSAAPTRGGGWTP